jgi:hypothetical protein
MGLIGISKQSFEKECIYQQIMLVRTCPVGWMENSEGECYSLINGVPEGCPLKVCKFNCYFQIIIYMIIVPI